MLRKANDGWLLEGGVDASVRFEIACLAGLRLPG